MAACPPAAPRRPHRRRPRPRARPRPTPLELVRRFVNTWDVESGADELADVAATRAWLVDHGLLDEGAAADRRATATG